MRRLKNSEKSKIIINIMEGVTLISILSMVLLVTTIGTMIMAVTAYVMFRLKDSKQQKTIKKQYETAITEAKKSGHSLDDFYKIPVVSNKIRYKTVEMLKPKRPNFTVINQLNDTIIKMKPKSLTKPQEIKWK